MSPRKVASVALAVGMEAFSDCSHLYSPHKFTQPQLFACLVIKEFEKKDYRGVCELLHEFDGLRETIGLKEIPHFTTLQKASRRLLKAAPVRSLIADTVRKIKKGHTRVKHAAADSSGFDAHHASRYFIFRTKVNQKGKEPKKRHQYKHYGKLMTIVDTSSHAILAAVPSVGPTPDIDQLDGVMDQLPPTLTLDHTVADAGFDSAHNHWLLRDYHGIRSTIPPEHGRPPRDPAALPKDKNRRLMKTTFQQKGVPAAVSNRDGVFDDQAESGIVSASQNASGPDAGHDVEGDHAQRGSGLDAGFLQSQSDPFGFPIAACQATLIFHSSSEENANIEHRTSNIEH